MKHGDDETKRLALSFVRNELLRTRPKDPSLKKLERLRQRSQIFTSTREARRNPTRPSRQGSLGGPETREEKRFSERFFPGLDAEVDAYLSLFKKRTGGLFSTPDPVGDTPLFMDLFRGRAAHDLGLNHDEAFEFLR